MGRIARWLRAGRLGELGDPGNGYCNLTYNDDLAAAVIASLTTPEVGGETFNVADLDPGTWNQYFVRLGRAIGAHVRRVSWLRIILEAAILAPPLQVAKLAARLTGVDPTVLPAPIPPSVVRLFRQRIRLDSRKAGALLAFPRTLPEQGLARSADWFRSATISR